MRTHEGEEIQWKFDQWNRVEFNKTIENTPKL